MNVRQSDRSSFPFAAEASAGPGKRTPGPRATLLPEIAFSALLRKAGILPLDGPPPAHLRLFVDQAQRALDEVRHRIAQQALSPPAFAEFQDLLLQIAVRVMSHPVTAGNNYLDRFAEGVTESQARHECQQFSVFAVQFEVAQAKLVANAPTLDAYHQRLRLLLNEKGFSYTRGFDGELSERWDAGAVHFSWLCDMAAGLGLGFDDVGKTWLALPGTQIAVDVTFEQFSHIDPSIACGAAFAIENWAASGLWKKLLAGMQKLNAGRTPSRQIDLRYLQYHDREEQFHAQAMLGELLGDFGETWFNPDRFLKGAETILTDGLHAYYESQLAALPEKDGTWPEKATGWRPFDAKRIPRVAGPLPAE